MIKQAANVQVDATSDSCGPQATELHAEASCQRYVATIAAVAAADIRRGPGKK